MRKITVFTFSLMLVSGLALSQSMSNKKTAQINEAEVPVSIRADFNREFVELSGKGSWSVYYSTTRKDGKVIATPIWYTFSGRDGDRKTEIRYLPDGKLKSMKGIARKSDVEQKQLSNEEDKSST